MTLGNVPRLLLAMVVCTAGGVIGGCGSRASLWDPPSTIGQGGGGGVGRDAEGGAGAGTGGSRPIPNRDAGVGGTGGVVPPPLHKLTGTIRDFKDTHPDFESDLCYTEGIVEKQLGSDGKPVYAGHGECETPRRQETFDQWYRDVPGVNMSKELTIKLERQPNGNYVYDNQAFFPIDGELFGNQGREHNFHFTYELSTSFTYQGGEMFTFQGDDDLFVFINNQLVIDLGGVHGAQTGKVHLDDVAEQLDLIVGHEYPLHFFYAERHTTHSTFRIETTIYTLVEPPSE